MLLSSVLNYDLQMWIKMFLEIFLIILKILLKTIARIKVTIPRWSICELEPKKHYAVVLLKFQMDILQIIKDCSKYFGDI